MKPAFEMLESRDVASSLMLSGPGTYADAMTPIYGAASTVVGGAAGAVADTTMGSSTIGSDMTVGGAAGLILTGKYSPLAPGGDSINTSNLDQLTTPIYTQPPPSQLQPSSPTNPIIAPQVVIYA